MRGVRDLACGQQQSVSMEVADLLIGIPVNAYMLCRVLKLEDEGTFATIPRHIKCSPFCVLRHPNAVQPPRGACHGWKQRVPSVRCPAALGGRNLGPLPRPLPSLECHHAARPHRSSQR
ncbi:hypothetical protein D3C81_2003790 [compost metagenome]